MARRRAPAAAGLLSLACAAADGAPTALTSNGRVAGVSVPGASIFYSLPYASPPVDALRWRPPAPHVPWNGTLDLGEVPEDSMCPQLLAVAGVPLFKGSERHCLTLTVYAPEGAKAGDALPVMVWIPGGA